MTTGDERELKVFITGGSDPECADCKDKLGRGAWIVPQPERRALCLCCADIDHLEFLPSGNTALTRRASKYASLSVVVLKWSRARKRFERQGLLVEKAALEKAEAECLADEDVRERRRERSAERRVELDTVYIGKFATRIGEILPRSPPAVRKHIAEHACRKHSGRVGRSASAKALHEDAVRLAVVAYVRHAETPYDRLLGNGATRDDARAQVRSDIDTVIRRWAPPVRRLTRVSGRPNPTPLISDTFCNHL